MYVCMVSKPKGSEAPHIAQLPFVYDGSHANTSKPSKSKKQNLVANSTAFAGRLARLDDTRLT